MNRRRDRSNGKVKEEHFVNEKIPFSKIFVLDNKGNKLGMMNKRKALEFAKQEGFDLVILSPNPKQPVAKLLDYGKFKYQKKQKNKEQKSKQSKTENREVRMTPLIGRHDLEVKSKKTREFILNGDRVKVSVKFRGRELARKELGYNKLQEFFETLEDIATIAKQPVLNGGRFLDMFLTKKNPNKKTGDNKVINNQLKKKEGDKNAKDEN
ncbi:MAG: translation initiation factor IF-3 [Mollicutes bacterium PWAP]|nr:translation initiation factor IF-3 [Mollicutes bacterium PWAP]